MIEIRPGARPMQPCVADERRRMNCSVSFIAGLLVCCGASPSPSVSSSRALGPTSSDPLGTSTPRGAGGCDQPIAGPDHLAIVWDGRQCTVELGSAVDPSSLELDVRPARAVDLQPVAPTQRADGAERMACSRLAQQWPETAGAYDVVLRDPWSNREQTTRLWLDPAANARALQKDTSTLVGAHHGTLLLDDGAGRWVGRLRGARGLFSDANYRDMSELTEPGGLRWDPVVGDSAGLQPSAARFGDQLLVSGHDLRWSIRSAFEEIAIASWTPDAWEAEVLAFGSPTASVVSVMLESEGLLRRVSLVKSTNCDWTEREEWRVELPLERELSAAGFNVRGEAAALLIERHPSEGPAVRLMDDRSGKPTFTEPHRLPAGFALPAHTSAAVRVSATGVLRGALMGRVPGEGFRLFELTSHGGVEAEQVTIPLTEVVVGRVDYDDDAPIWVVRTAEGRMGLGHGPNLEEACFVDEIVEGAPFIGGGGIAWQTGPGAELKIGLCDWVPIRRMGPRVDSVLY